MASRVVIALRAAPGGVVGARRLRFGPAVVVVGAGSPFWCSAAVTTAALLRRKTLLVCRLLASILLFIMSRAYGDMLGMRSLHLSAGILLLGFDLCRFASAFGLGLAALRGAAASGGRLASCALLLRF